MSAEGRLVVSTDSMDFLHTELAKWESAQLGEVSQQEWPTMGVHEDGKDGFRVWEGKRPNKKKNRMRNRQIEAANPAEPQTHVANHEGIPKPVTSTKGEDTKVYDRDYGKDGDGGH